MALHPTIAEFVAKLPPSDGSVPDVAAWRAQGESQVPPPHERLPLHAVTDRVVATASGEVPIRVYQAEGRAPNGALVYLHGGAFFSGSLDTHDAIARNLAKASGFVVVSVGYRLAPEAPFPAGLDDAYGVLRWVVEHPHEIGWDGERLALAGDSSGGNFVAALTAMVHDDGLGAVTHQVLFYPSVDLNFDDNIASGRFPSLTEHAVGYGLETSGLKPHNSFYLASGAEPSDPRVSPILREDLSGLPEALIITAEFDPLRDEGEAYAERLREAGVPVTLTRVEGANHGFVQFWSWLPDFEGVFAEVGEFLRG